MFLQSHLPLFDDRFDIRIFRIIIGYFLQINATVHQHKDINYPVLKKAVTNLPPIFVVGLLVG